MSTCSCILSSCGWELPSVLRVCVQLRQTAEFVSAHGGRVCWDESTLSFALAVDEQLDRVQEEVRGAQNSIEHSAGMVIPHEQHHWHRMVSALRFLLV